MFLLKERLSPLHSLKLARTMLTFDKTPLALLESTKALAGYGKKELDRIVQAARLNPSFENVIKPIALLEAKMWADGAKLSFPQYVSELKDLREASSEAKKILEVTACGLIKRNSVLKRT